VSASRKLRSQRNGRFHRNAKGLYYKHQGSDRFVVACRASQRTWVYGRVIWHGDFDRVGVDDVQYFSEWEWPSYKLALEAAEWRKA